MYMWSLYRMGCYMVVLTCVRQWCPHGCLGCPGRVCSGVCARSGGGLWLVFCLVGVPHVGSHACQDSLLHISISLT